MSKINTDNFGVYRVFRFIYDKTYHRHHKVAKITEITLYDLNINASNVNKNQRWITLFILEIK